ncbi:MAG: hypothetical protein ACKOC5_10375 [Chloroflexota bacterium]
MKKIKWIALLLLLAGLLFPAAAHAQSYLFTLDELRAVVDLQADGSASIDYWFTFTNAPGAHAIDFVDVGMPNDRFSMVGVQADVDGFPVSVSRSDYAGNGSGFAFVLGREEIRPGASRTVHVHVPDAGGWLRYDSQADDYASFAFMPTYFCREFVQGSTQISVTIVFPPGVQPDEPRWHEAPGGFPATPGSGVDEQGRVFYQWINQSASGAGQYDFGVSFPASYVPASAVTRPSLAETLGISEDTLLTVGCCGSIGLFLAGIIFLSNRSASRRKLQYMPPKVAIEGLGIKRGLTAVEAAVLMELPLDKVLTMILFGLVKKNAALVKTREPLELESVSPRPDDLHPYEAGFLDAFERPKSERRRQLQTMIVELARDVSTKMKGFSKRETVAYYKDIAERAWKQVEAAQTPQVKSETFEKYMEWTMMDREYDGRTRRVFTGPVYVPTWWGRYDPGYRPTPVSTSGCGGGGGQGGSFSLPTLPGSSFAASVIGGVQNFSAGVVGDLTSFTGGVTEKTNPVPKPTSSGGSFRGGSGGGGRSCACACACAGCACACAGGGR